jgi:hypothetical protein
MTSTGLADVTMSACGRASAGRPVLAQPGFRELVSVWPLSREPTVVRAVFPCSVSLKPASCRPPGRPRRAQLYPPKPPHRPVRESGSPRPPCRRPPALAYPVYLYLPEWPGTAVSVSSFDPGRDVLCILTSPPRWLQWP